MSALFLPLGLSFLEDSTWTFRAKDYLASPPFDLPFRPDHKPSLVDSEIKTTQVPEQSGRDFATLLESAE